MFLPTLFFPSYIPPAFRVSFLGASEAARDLRVSRRLLTGTQRLNFRCNWLTAITFHSLDERAFLSNICESQGDPYIWIEISAVFFSFIIPDGHQVIDFLFFAFYRSSTVNNSYSFSERTYFTSFPEPFNKTLCCNDFKSF